MPDAGRVALVTGGSRGIGRAIALKLAQDGHRVAVNYRERADAAAEVVRLIEEMGGVAIAVQGDVGKAEDVKRVFAEVTEKLGPVQVLVNNAGIERTMLLIGLDEDAWDQVIESNLKSVYLCSRTAARQMIKARWGRIISISSVVAKIGGPAHTNYAASKAGIIGFTKSIAREFSSRNITANAVAPGFIQTEMTEKLSEKAREEIFKQIPMGKLGTPKDVAGVCLFLASSEADYITGQTIVVDGGMAI